MPKIAIIGERGMSLKSAVTQELEKDFLKHHPKGTVVRITKGKTIIEKYTGGNKDE